MYEKDTIISPITSISEGSVSLIRISGADAIKIITPFFSSVKLESKLGGSFFFGKLVSESKKIIDEVIVYFFRNPKSYTGEDVIEISCHSNVFIVEEILQLFIRNGCRLSKPGEFTQRAFLNGKMDLAQAESVAEIISSKSKAGVKNALNVLEGKLSSKLTKLKKSIIDIASLLELELDFSEEDLEILSEKEFKSTLNSFLIQVERLLSSFSNSKQFQKGVEVLITGKPNVGKSSLMNALLEKDRVIVSHIPGTTRDFIHEDIIIEDTLVRLIDTAGIRFSEDQIEAAGVDKAKKIISTADIILVLFDLSEKIEKDDQEIVSLLLKERKDRLLFIGNKSDKKILSETEKYLESFSIKTVFVSAKKDDKIDLLREVISEHIKKDISVNREDVLLTNKRHFDILLKVKMQTEKTISSFLKKPGYEFIAMDLREIINTLSEITGEITTDDILNNIFSSFCIGK